ncbi:succinate dehydrogenase [Mycobacteroides abscessus subsp. abscessus]|nr:succinate dehydrogenase [Mycobacteroides abscessus subsp. abscessus]
MLGSTYDDGLGIRLGVSAGGATRNMNQIFVTAPVYPPSGLLTGIIVNKNGERFVSEDSYHSRTSGFVMDQVDSAAYLIVDSEHMDRPTLPLTPFIDGWETVAEMEAALGIPAGNLDKTLQRYNEYAAKGEDPDFHKHPASASNIAQDGKGYSSGTRLGEASFFGRRAGSHASVRVSVA